MRLRNYYGALLFFLSAPILYGQADSILQLPPETQSYALYHWFEARYSITDSATFEGALAKMKHDFERAGKEDLALQVRRQRIFFITYMYYAWDPRGLEMIDAEIAIARKEGWKAHEAELLVHRGNLNMNYGRYVHAFENFIRGYEIMKEIGFDKVSTPQKWLSAIGTAYYQLGATDHAIHYFKEAIALPLPIPDPSFKMITGNTLGLCYSRQMKYDSAIIEFQKSHDLAVEYQAVVYEAVTNGNMGFAYFKKGDDERALPLLEADFNLSREVNEIASAANASLSLATIYLRKGDKSKAEFYTQYSTKHVDRRNNKQMHSFFLNLSELSKISGDYRQALMYRDSAQHYQKIVLAAEEKDILERARLELEVQKHTNAVNTLEAVRKRQIMLRNLILMALVSAGLIASVWIQRRFIRRKKELESAQKELTRFTDMIREKNELLSSFSREIEELRSPDHQLSDERTKYLTELSHAQILTEDDWKQFRILFDKVHPGFFIRLREKMPDLTASEIRLMALTRLQLAPREMASMLGISYDSILKTRQRLRKKIHIPEEGTLDELLEAI